MELQSEKHLKTIDEEAALQLDHNDKSLFVFSNFSTPAFHHCKKLGCRVVSTLVVHFCLQHQRCVPKAEQPVYNMAMADITISCTSLDKEAREDEYDWGRSSILDVLPSISSQQKRLALAAMRWRRNLQDRNDQEGSFSGWTVMLNIDQTRESGFRRLLQSGAKVLPSPSPSLYKGTTHLFAEFSRLKPGDFRKDVPEAKCLKPEFIADYLIQEPIPPIEMYYLPEAAQCLPADTDASRATPSCERKASGDSTKLKKTRLK